MRHDYRHTSSDLNGGLGKQ